MTDNPDSANKEAPPTEDPNSPNKESPTTQDTDSVETSLTADDTNAESLTKQ